MRLVLPLALLALPLVAAPAGGPTQKAKAAEKAAPAAPAKLDWDGEWKLKPSQSDKFEERLDEHVKDLNFAMKLFWKKKIQGACQTFDKMDIFASETFSVTMGREVPLDTPTDGTASEWKRRDGQKFQATLKVEGRTMTQTLTGDGFSLVYVYSLRADGQSLALQVTYSHPKLDNPFSYKMVFRKED